MKSKIFFLIKYMLGVYALDRSPKLAKEKGLEKTLIFLKKSYPLYRPPLVKFLIQLYQNQLNLERLDIKMISPTNKTNLIFHFCCWGSAYQEKVRKVLLPSLLAEGNIPAIANKYNLHLLIHCDENTKNQLEKSNIINLIKIHSIVHFITIPKNLFNLYHNCFFKKLPYSNRINVITKNIKYLLLGGLQAHAFQLSQKTQSVISFLMPDIAFSNGFFNLAHDAIAGKKAVLATAFRTNYSSIKKELSFFYKKNHTVLSADPASLTKLQIAHIHPSAKQQIVSENTLDFSPCAQLIFLTNHGYIIRSFHYHPILVDCRKIDADVRIDYLPIDNSTLNNIVSKNDHYSNQIHVLESSNTACFIEMSDEKIGSHHIKTGKKLDYLTLLKSIKNMIKKNPGEYDTPLNRYLFSLKYTITSTNFIQEKSGFINDDTFFQDLKIGP